MTTQVFHISSKNPLPLDSAPLRASKKSLTGSGLHQLFAETIPTPPLSDTLHRTSRSQHHPALSSYHISGSLGKLSPIPCTLPKVRNKPKLKTNIYSAYEGGCFLFNVLLFTLYFDSSSQLYFLKQ